MQSILGTFVPLVDTLTRIHQTGQKTSPDSPERRFQTSGRIFQTGTSPEHQPGNKKRVHLFRSNKWEWSSPE